MEVLAQDPASPPAHRLTLPFEVPAKYQPLRMLGAGGMGTVLLARDRHLGRLVALKFLSESCPAFLERFRREARLMARLSHAAVVRVHEFDLIDGRAYLAMDYLDGGNLAHARLEPRALALLLRRIVDALGHAHALGVIHRDIKPENVLLDRRGRGYLGDFGLALGSEEGRGRSAGEAVHARTILGTPLTMSPEQALGAEVGPPSDVFSLGVTLYRQLTGEWPFRGRTVADVLHAIQHEAPRPPRSLEPQVPRELERIVLRSLEKDQERRFRSMAELGAALDRFLDRRTFFARVRARIVGLTQRELTQRGLTQRGGHASPRIHPEDFS